MSSAFVIDVPDEDLEDLRRRLAATRWPRIVHATDWSRGTSVDYMRELVSWWHDGFDWRRQEAELNRYPHFRAEIDERVIHYVHVRGQGDAPMPLLLTHGWPSTFAELLPLVAPLTDPCRFGGDPGDSFDVVIPSLPGYGFSDPLPAAGGANAVPGLLARLMTETLGYERFGAHGGDIGGMVTNRLAFEFPELVTGIHVSMVAEPDAERGPPLSPAERVLLDRRPRQRELDGAYAHVQRTRPHTLAHALADSPAGLAAWLIDKWRAWSDCDGDLERRFTKDELLTTVTLYWVTESIATSFQFYADWALGTASLPIAWVGRDDVPGGVDSRPLAKGHRIEVPAGVAVFRGDTWPREWAARAYGDLRRFAPMPRGGHFSALEEPDLLAEEIRAFFRPLR